MLKEWIETDSITSTSKIHGVEQVDAIRMAGAVGSSPVEQVGRSWKVWSFSAGRAFRVEHLGSYRHLGNAWSIANQIARYKQLKQCRLGGYEIYRTVPPTVQAGSVHGLRDVALPI